MSKDRQTPVGLVADTVSNNWVNKKAPSWSQPYLRLSRVDRPIGTWLLLLPCWWGALLASTSDSLGYQLLDLWIVIGCGIGAILMRGAGCTWNDIVDKDIDFKVERTRHRPLHRFQHTQVLQHQILMIMCVFQYQAVCHKVEK